MIYSPEFPLTMSTTAVALTVVLPLPAWSRPNIALEQTHEVVKCFCGISLLSHFPLNLGGARAGLD